ncbi:MAG: ABC transporter substrate-binding protein [Planctomycetes bacterium]|nr:ABC transporter substrate-binding protein [Planctomycetota bacterium]
MRDSIRRRHRRRRLWLLVAIIGLLAAALPACRPSGAPGESEEPGERSASAGAGLRIVSLSPAVTQMVRDLGLESSIVAAGRYDPVAPREAEVVGDLYQLDYEKLLRLRPDHIFLQPGRPGVPARLERMAADHGWRLHHYQIHKVEDVLRALHSSEGSAGQTGVGEALGAAEKAAALAAKLRDDLERLSALTRGRRAPRTLLLFGLDPLTGVGRETFLGEMLEIAGGDNALPAGGPPYPVLDREKLLALAPEAIVVIRSTDASPDPSVEQPSRYLAGLRVPAVHSGAIACLEDRLALLPSTSMARIAARLAEILHPDLASRIDDLIAPDGDQP